MHCIKSRFEIRKGIQILIDYDEEEKEIDKTGHYRDIYKHGFICCPPQKKSIHIRELPCFKFYHSRI